MNCRQYIEVVYSDNPGGAIIELVDGVMTVTGFDVETAQGDANTGYIVSIPATYNGVAVTAIAEGAFKGNGSIVTVSIPSSVTVIGAEAFMDTVNLTTVTIAPGGLSVVGRSAFENSGFTSIALPLANLTEVGAYAFKSEKLIYFTAAEGETPLLLTNFIVTEMVEDTSNYVSSIIKTLIGVEAYVDIDTIDTGTFGYIKDSYGHYIAIFQYMGVDTAEKAAGAETEEVTVYDVRLIAVAGGAYAEQGSTSSSYAISFGLSWRDNYYSNALYTPYLKNAVVRFEIMEGSVYYLDGTSSIVLGVVSKVHENAFTDINESSAVVIYTKTEDAYDDTWLTKDDLNDGTIFENGWWQGMDMSSDEYEKFVNNITEYTRSLH